MEIKTRNGYYSIFTPPMQEISEIIRDFGRSQISYYYNEAISIFDFDPETRKNIKELKEHFHYNSEKPLNVEIFFKNYLTEYFDKIDKENKGIVDNRIYSFNHDESAVELNLNELLLEFLNKSTREDYFENCIEVLFLLIPTQKQGIKLFSKFLNHENIELKYIANKEFKKYLIEDKEEVMNKIYAYLNNGINPEEGDGFYRYIREDPELFNKLYIDKPTGLRVLLMMIKDSNRSISELGKQKLDGIKSSHFMNQLPEYINTHANIDEFNLLFPLFVKNNIDLNNLDVTSCSGFKMLLLISGCSDMQYRDDAKEILENSCKYILTKQDYMNFLNSEYIVSDDILSLLYYFSRTLYLTEGKLDSDQKDILFSLCNKFPNNGLTIKTFISIF